MIKTNFKKRAGVYTSKLAATSDLASLKAEVDKTDRQIKDFSCWLE